MSDAESQEEEEVEYIRKVQDSDLEDDEEEDDEEEEDEGADSSDLSEDDIIKSLLKKKKEQPAKKSQKGKQKDSHPSDFEDYKSEDVASIKNSEDMEELQAKVDYENLSSDFYSHSSDEQDLNPHGFTFGHQLDTMRRNKKERIEELKQEQEANHESHREKFKRKDRKGGGSTNKDKLKHKPMQMVI